MRPSLGAQANNLGFRVRARATLSNSLTLCRAALPHGRASDRLAAKSEGLQFPEALPLRRLKSALAFYVLDLGIQVLFELIGRDCLVPLYVAEADGGRVIVLFNHLRLNRHSLLVDPKFDVFVAGRGFRGDLHMFCPD